MALQFDFKTLGQPVEVSWPVKVTEPLDGGKVRESEFTAIFRIASENEANAAMNPKKIKNEAGEEEPSDPHALFRLVFVGLDDKHGELTEELFLQMVERPYVRNAILQAYFRCANGVLLKN